MLLPFQNQGGKCYCSSTGSEELRPSKNATITGIWAAALSPLGRLEEQKVEGEQLCLFFFFACFVFSISDFQQDGAWRQRFRSHSHGSFPFFHCLSPKLFLIFLNTFSQALQHPRPSVSALSCPGLKAEKRQLRPVEATASHH